jgi:acyl-coenzyme A thioesterase PaaI-like protein
MSGPSLPAATPAGVPDNDSARAWTTPAQVPGPWRARRRAADALRALIAEALTADDDELALDAFATSLEQLAGSLPRGLTAAEAWRTGAYVADASAWVDRSALSGRCNAIAPPMPLSWTGTKSEARLTLGEAYTGAPGMVHGGVLAACFDQVGGHCLVMSGFHGFTTRLDVRYLRPGRIGRELRFEAQLTSSDDRTVTFEARCADGETTIATAALRFARLDVDLARAVITGQPQPATEPASPTAASDRPPTEP